MHDVLAHRISLLSLHAGALEIRPELPTEEVARAAGTIRTSAHQALDDLREIVGVLRRTVPSCDRRPAWRVQVAILVLEAGVAGCLFSRPSSRRHGRRGRE